MRNRRSSKAPTSKSNAIRRLEVEHAAKITNRVDSIRAGLLQMQKAIKVENKF